jgi:RNA polymerase sigma-70 factor (ECF subfamily)
MPIPAPRRFVTTRWSLVLAAGGKAAPETRTALSELCEIYWSPLYAFVRHQGHSAEDAKDLLQGFFARLLEKNELAVADPGRGRFRSWLLASVKHYLSNAWERDRAHKRGGNQVRLGGEDAERHLDQQPDSGLTPEQAYERRWAEQLLKNVLAALGEEYARGGKGPLFEKLKQTLTGEAGDSYSRLAEELGMTPSAVKVAAFRLRQRYQAMLHWEVSHTVESPEEVADELRFLISALEDR